MLTEYIVKYHHHRLLSGLILLFVSLIPFFLPTRASWFLTLAFACYCLGITLVSDYAAMRLTGHSYLESILTHSRVRANFFVLGVMGG